MTTTPAALCNLALGRIGHTRFLSSLAEDTAEAQACAVAYPHSRATVLASFPWPFATRRAALAELAAVTRSGWGYVYSLPADFVAARYLYNAANVGPLETAAKRTRYSLEDHGTRRVLLTDEAGAELVYTADIETLAAWPVTVRDALAWHLAAELALSLAVKPQLAAMLLQQYERVVARAAAIELRQSQDGPPAESEFIRERS